MAIRVKRVYEPAEAGDGARFLVDRLWPRGVKKESLQLDGWLKDAAPSDDLWREKLDAATAARLVEAAEPALSQRGYT